MVDRAGVPRLDGRDTSPDAQRRHPVTTPVASALRIPGAHAARARPGPAVHAAATGLEPRPPTALRARKVPATPVCGRRGGSAGPCRGRTCDAGTGHAAGRPASTPPPQPPRRVAANAMQPTHARCPPCRPARRHGPRPAGCRPRLPHHGGPARGPHASKPSIAGIETIEWSRDGTLVYSPATRPPLPAQPAAAPRATTHQGDDQWPTSQPARPSRT
jgi:hypothetical protein